MSYHVYAPLEYDEPDARLPVLYWLHGTLGGVAGIRPVSAHFGAEIRAGRMPPLLVVFVNGLPRRLWADSKDGAAPVETVFITELIPEVDRSFRTVATRDLNHQFHERMTALGIDHGYHEIPDVGHDAAAHRAGHGDGAGQGAVLRRDRRGEGGGGGSISSLASRLADRERELAILRTHRQEVEEQAGRKGPLPSAAKLLDHLEAVKGQLLGDEARAAAMLKRTLLVDAFAEPQLVKHARLIVVRRLEGKTYKEIAKECDLTDYHMENCARIVQLMATAS